MGTPRGLPLVVALALTACTSSPAARPKLNTIPAAAGASLISDRGAVISNNGAGLTVSGTIRATASIISNNGGAILGNNGAGVISNNGSGILGNNGAGIVSNNGGGIVGQGANNYALLAKLDERPIGGIRVALRDAAGQAVLGKDGKPLEALTEPDGKYAFRDPVDARNLVVAAIFPSGAELRAIVPRQAEGTRSADADLASTLVAGHVLDRLLPAAGEPDANAVLERLPPDVARETDALARAALDAGAAPPPEALGKDAVATAVAALRAADARFDAQLVRVQQLLVLGSTTAATSDGPALKAALDEPNGAAVGPDGTVYFTDTLQYLVRKLTPAGRVETIAGSGTAGAADGRGAAASFDNPTAIAVGAAGELYVADGVGLVRRIAPDGAVTTLVGPDAALDLVVALAPTPDALYFCDPYSVLRLDLRAPGAAPTVVARAVTPTAEDPAPVGFLDVRDLVIDAKGQLFLADRERGTIWQVTPDGRVTAFATGFEALHTLAAGPDGALQAYAGTQLLRVAAGAGRSVPRELRRRAGGPDPAATLATDMAIAPDGTVYLVEPTRDMIRKVAPDGTLADAAGNGGAAFDGDVDAARFALPFDVVGAPSGDLFIADLGRQQIRKLSADGQTTTLAGSGAKGRTDGPGAAASFTDPASLARGADGTLYVGEYGAVRAIAPDGTVRTLAGGAETGGADGKGAAARLYQPYGMAVAADGSLWFADGANHAVRRVAADGAVTTVAGMLGQKGDADGRGAQARFEGPNDVAIGPDGAAYVADYANHAIRRVTADGRVTTVARGVPREDDPAVTFSAPASLVVDDQGRIFVASTLEEAIFRIDPGGKVHHMQLPLQDGKRLQQPLGMWIDAARFLVVVDSVENVLRRYALDGPAEPVETR